MVEDENKLSSSVMPQEFFVELHSQSNQHNTSTIIKRDLGGAAEESFSTPLEKYNSLQIDDVLLDS